jgi:hypothetical protein
LNGRRDEASAVGGASAVATSGGDSPRGTCGRNHLMAPSKTCYAIKMDGQILAKDQGLTVEDGHEAFIYNHRYNRVDKIGKNKGITSYIHWHEANDYVESLVSTH